MSDTVKCVDCGVTPHQVLRPAYRVNATWKAICPKPRCNNCRTKYEAKMLKPRKDGAGGLTKIANDGGLPEVTLPKGL